MTIVANDSLTISNVNDGTITHTAWSYSADGTDRFTTVYPNLNLLKGTRNLTATSTTTVWDTLFSSSQIYDSTIKSKTGVSAMNFSFSVYVPLNAAVGSGVSIQLKGQSSQAPNIWGDDYNTIICLTNYIIKQSDLGKTIRISIPILKGDRYRTFDTALADTDSITIRQATDTPEFVYSKLKLESGSTATPYLQSASEVTTADWPSYIGQYTDFTQADSTNPSAYTWSLIRGNDGKDGADGHDGRAGKDGVGIKTTVITYAISTSGTTAPNTGWTSSVPSLVKGQYLWTKTVWTYTDNSSETGYSVTYISKDGNNGNDGIAGKDGVGIKTTTITYASHTNGTTPPTTGYTTTVPSVPAGQFLWTKTVWTYTDNSTETGYSVAMMGVKGDQGIQGIQGRDGIAGKDGKGINLTTITYAISTSGTTAPTTGYTSTVPTLIKGQYLWTKTVWRYTDNSTETGYSVAYIAQDGNNGTNGVAGKDGVGIKTTTITYAGSASGTTAPTTGWTTTVPTVAAGNYLWTKTVWAYTDNTSETGYSVAKMGNTGPTGPAGAPGSNGAPGKIVSNSEPISLFTGLTWKYSGTTDLTARDGTVILSGTEYYWNGTAWALYEINAHNINGDNLSVTNGTFKDGKIESIWGKNGVNGTTTIESSHLQIYSSDSTTNTENTVAIDNLQGYAQVSTDRNTGRTITVQASVQGFFVSDSTGPYVRLTPQGLIQTSKKATVNFGYGRNVTLTRHGSYVTITSQNCYTIKPANNTWIRNVATLPLGYRPVDDVLIYNQNLGNGSKFTWSYLHPNGVIDLFSSGNITTTDYILSSAQSWITNDALPS